MTSHPTLITTAPAFKTPLGVSVRYLEDLDQDVSLRPLHRALEETTSICRELGTYREGVERDDLLSDSGKQQKIREHGTLALIGADKIFANALSKADASVERLEAELDCTLPALTETEHAAEIRQHAKAMPASERRAFFLAAQREGDVATISALLNAPGYLSGLSDADVALVRERRAEAAAKAKPVPAKRLEQLKTARQRVEQARKSLDAERVRAFGGHHRAAV